MRNKLLSLLLLVLPLSVNAQERQPNHLLGASSPYLKQHLYNPVDWYPWGEEALEKARTENKPIFLSVGYFSCHWCHVMEAESFENEEIAAFMNENFISIKVDRERRPDLDEQFMLVTQALTGSGGWPNSVFLSSLGDPFYAGTYYPPEGFMQILGAVNDSWRADTTGLLVEAANFSTYIRNFMAQSATAAALTPEIISASARAVLPEMDEFNGGMGVSPKFPQESMYLFLLDQSERDGNAELFEAVTNALDGMLRGGIHDQVGGGFHRYSTDPEWTVPHFEKMLYNQAMIGRLLLRVWQATGEARYKRAAIRTFDFVLREMRDQHGGFYAAQDADSFNELNEYVEGAYYTWTADEVSKIIGENEVSEIFGISTEGNFEGENILFLNTFPEDVLYETLDPALEMLRVARLTRERPATDTKIIVSENAVMIATLVEASAALSRPEYHSAAVDAMRYILDDMVLAGSLKRSSFEGAIGVDAQLQDYAALGLALMALHDYSVGEDAQYWLGQAADIAHEMMALFETDAGAYRMAKNVEGIGVYIPLDDGNIPGGNAMALSLLVGLGNRTEDLSFGQNATLLSAAIGGGAASRPSSRGATLQAAQSLSHGEGGRVRYVAHGAVRIALETNRNSGELQLNIRVADGWHINANVPLEEYLIPTELVVDGVVVGAEIYPEPLLKSLAFNSKELALYEGEITLRAPIKPGVVTLNLQACSDEICLAPEEVNFRVW